jgi:ectoine hydroxylase-related dioxygenase (phytanoyl-CoA dioxygenase family)
MKTIPQAVLDELNSPFDITDEQVNFFRENGYIKIANVLSKEVIAAMDEIISEEVTRLNTQHLAMKDRDTYGKAFLQIMNIWRNSEAVKQIVFSKRLGQIASDLLEVSGVRLYHDQALYKEPSGGHTPWHADQYYWPLASPKTVTAWIPLQETPLEFGPLEFSASSFKLTDGRDKAISDESQELLDQLLKNSGFRHSVAPFSLGEVSFHTGWLYHRAGPNLTDKMRKVMTMIYMDKDMTLKAPENKNQQADWDTWCPGVQVGALVDSPLNPVIYAAV